MSLFNRLREKVWLILLIIIFIYSIDKIIGKYYDVVNDNQYQKGVNTMSLAMVALGETKTIRDFTGKEEMKRHLQDLGFIKGENVKVVGENSSGMIILLKGVKIALNRGLAAKILVN